MTNKETGNHDDGMTTVKQGKAGKSRVARIGRMSPRSAQSPQRGPEDKHGVVGVLVERGAIALERVLRASSKQEVLKLLAPINEAEFLKELSRLALKNLDSEPLGLPGRTTGERRRVKLVRRLAWLTETGKLGRKPKETRLQALLRHLDRKTDSELETMINKLESGQSR